MNMEGQTTTMLALQQRCAAKRDTPRLQADNLSSPMAYGTYDCSRDLP
jgi:hypothetical protein